MRKLVMPLCAAMFVFSAQCASAAGMGRPHAPMGWVPPAAAAVSLHRGRHDHGRLSHGDRRESHRSAGALLAPGGFFAPTGAWTERERAPLLQPSAGGHISGIVIQHTTGQLAQGDSGYVAQPLIIAVEPRAPHIKAKLKGFRAAPFAASRIMR